MSALQSGKLRMPTRPGTPSGPIRNILFDFGSVLVHFDYDIMFRRFAQKSPLTVLEIRRRLFDNADHRAFERGEIPAPRYYQIVRNQIQIRMDYRTFYEAWADIFWPDEAMLDLAERLKKNYQLYLLSNTNEIHYTEFLRIPRLMKAIPRQGLSFEYGVMKPDPEIYRRFLDEFDLHAGESVLIDDVLENVQSAREMGMHGIPHRNLKSTCRMLEEMGVLIPGD